MLLLVSPVIHLIFNIKQVLNLGYYAYVVYAYLPMLLAMQGQFLVFLFCIMSFYFLLLPHGVV